MTHLYTISKVFARQIFDSRGNPTVEVEVTTLQGTFRAGVPSGASTGIHEALELRDGQSKEYLGKGVFNAIRHVNQTIGPKLVEAKLDVTNQAAIDEWMLKLDGTPKKSVLGANAILGVSMAVARAGAAAKGLPLYAHIAQLAGNTRLTLPCPSFNVINGGAHASNPIAFQEFMILPTGASSFCEAMKMGTEVYHHLKQILAKKYRFDVQVGDEGGFAPNLNSPATTLKVIEEAIAAAGYTGKIHLALDVAASEFYTEENMYDLDKKRAETPKEQHRQLTGAELVEEYYQLKEAFPMCKCLLLWTEDDPFDQDDWQSWSKLTASLPIQVVGDDLTVTSLERIQMALERKACNALLLKINQIGTLTESIQAAKLVQSKGWGLMVSHRSGETEDTFIADVAVGLNAGQIKSGAPCRSERLAKYNQLLRIEEELGAQAVYTGMPSHLRPQ